MAKVIGLFQLRGTVGDLTIRKTADGIIAGMKPGPTREKVLTHKKFSRTRRNAAEFKLAIEEGTLLRHALSTALYGRKGSSLNGRMNGLFYTVARHDCVSDLGCRRASQGDISLLRGFDFNKQLLLEHALPMPLLHQLDVERGTCQVKIPSFIARKRKGFPPEATHFRIVSGVALVDFLRGDYERDVQQSELLPLRTKTPEGMCFEHRLEPGAGKVMVQVLGMEFYKLVGEREVLVKGSAVQILEAVRVEESKEALRQQGNERRAETQIVNELQGTRIIGELHELEKGNEALRQRGNEVMEELRDEEELVEAWIEDELQGTQIIGELHELGVKVEKKGSEGRKLQGVEEDDGTADRKEQEEAVIVSDMDSCYGVLSLFPEVVLLE